MALPASRAMRHRPAGLSERQSRAAPPGSHRGRVGGTNTKAERFRARTGSQHHSLLCWRFQFSSLLFKNSFSAIPDSLSFVKRPCSGRVDPVVCGPVASRPVCRRTRGSSGVPQQPAHWPQLEVSAPSGHGPCPPAEKRLKFEIGSAHWIS